MIRARMTSQTQLLSSRLHKQLFITEYLLADWQGRRNAPSCYQNMSKEERRSEKSRNGTKKRGRAHRGARPPGGVGRSVGDPFDVRADLGGTVGGVEKTGDLGFVPSLDLAVGHFARVALRADGDGNDLCFHG